VALTIKIDLHLGPLRRYESQIRAGSPATRVMLQQWGDMHRIWLRKRFIKFSQGGGDWAPLKQSTIDRKGGDDTILIRTGEMFAALKSRRINMARKSVTVGIFGGGRNSKVAAFHQAGTQNMPQRLVVVEPPRSELRKMKKVAEKLLGEEAKRMNPSI